jgi:anti-anti-sigma factor
VSPTGGPIRAVRGRTDHGPRAAGADSTRRAGHRDRPARLAEAAESLLSQQPQSLVIDLTGTAFLDSSGARQLVRTARRAAADGISLEVVCPRSNRPVRLVVDLLELQAVVPIVEWPSLLEGEVGP